MTGDKRSEARKSGEGPSGRYMAYRLETTDRQAGEQIDSQADGRQEMNIHSEIQYTGLSILKS